MTPSVAIAAGCALIPSDRQGAGAVTTLSVTENINLAVLGEVSRAWALVSARLADNAASLAERFDIKPRDPSLLFGALSGGNQQKVLIAKWLQASPRLLLLDEPTQGVDVGARAQVFSAIAKAAKGGATVLCASSDYEQLCAICDCVWSSAGARCQRHFRRTDQQFIIAEACYRSA